MPPAAPARRPLTVCIDARLRSGAAGGVEQVIIGLAAGLSQLTDGDERYLFLTWPGSDGWLAPYLRGNTALLRCGSLGAAVRGLGGRALASVPGVVPVWKLLREARGPQVPASDGTVERAGADLMHFTFQDGFTTSVPSIYHPHDLQHLHLPEFFTDGERRRREVLYRALCAQARMVAVTSSWIRRDLLQQYGLPDDRVRVVPWAPVTGHYGRPTAHDLRRLRAQHDLPETFLLFPAQTWPHKNHLALLRALALLRDRHGLVAPLVCCGRLTEHFAEIEREVRKLGLGDTTRFLGFVEPLELQGLYALARGVVIPSRFEAASFPLWEAFANGVAAACSNVTSLPEQAGDAALVFDPASLDSVADAVRALWTDEALRSRLVARGRERVARFTWERTARTFRAHYRRLAGQTLDEADLALLAADPLL